MTEGTRTSETKVPFLSKRRIESEAALVLDEFGARHGVVAAPPVPIDEIVEVHLRLTIEFKDMQALFGVGDVHGALWINEKRVGIDVSLDPEKYPAKRGRYHFTLAHEAGHWLLHRKLFQRHTGERSLLPDGDERPKYVCRSSDNSPLEQQANRFAACLLMPRELVKRAWAEWHGDLSAIYVDDLRKNEQEILKEEFQRRGGMKTGANGTEDMLLEHCSRPLAERFHVSAEAMRIRLENLQFLLRKREPTLFD